MADPSNSRYDAIAACALIVWGILVISGFSNTIPIGTGGNLELSLVEAFAIVMIGMMFVSLIKREAKQVAKS
jgi:hypothetical protein